MKLFGNGRVYKVKLTLSPDIVENWLISRPHPLLNGQSFEDRLRDSLVSVDEQTRKQKVPDLVILTGGPSRMQFFQELCRSQFRSSRVIVSPCPEYDISRGLTFVGSVDENMTDCIRDINAYLASDAMEEKVEQAVPALVRNISQPLTDAILTNCVKPAFNAWRTGGLTTLNSFEADTKSRIQLFMRSSTMQSTIREQVEPWSEEIIHDVEMDICEISRKHHVDLSIGHGTLNIQASGGSSNPLTINFINVIQGIISIVLVVVMAMICGGAGFALFVSGPVGIVIGALIALLAIAIGKDAATEFMMKFNFPVFVRRLISVDSIVSEDNRKKISDGIYEGMLKDREMVDDLVDQVSECIETAISAVTSDVEHAMVA